MERTVGFYRLLQIYLGENNMEKNSIENCINNIENDKLKSIVKKLYAGRFLYLLALPTIAWYILFRYFPIYGIKYAFQNIGVSPNPKFIGFRNFILLFSMPEFLDVLRNTILISLYKIVWRFPMTIILALMLNDVKNSMLRRSFQTIVYLPHFLSWVIIGGLWFNFLSPAIGPVNAVIKYFGGDPVYFWIQKKYFRSLLVITDIWKGMGYGTILYLATLSGVDLQLYEAATVDGAKKFKQMWYITLPALKSVMVITFIFSFAGILDIFEQVFVLINPLVKEVGDVIDTYTYYTGISRMNVGFGTAVGLFKNAVGLILMLSTNALAKWLTGESFF